MEIITIDAETFWSMDYSLTKMSPLAYVMGDQFELISLAIKRGQDATQVYFGDEVEPVVTEIDWSNAMVVGHNLSGFDAYILAYRLGIQPKMWACTMAMARPIHAKDVGLSLAKLVKHYGIGVKDNTILMNTRGRHLKDFTPSERAAMRTYNADDTDQCRALFDILLPHYTAREMWQIDALVRMRTEPAFETDTQLLVARLASERARKRASLMELGDQLGIAPGEDLAEAVRAELASAPKFCALLESLGVEPPVKPSPTNPDTEIPALAKTDEEFLALQEHENELVAAATRARLDVKSTLLETRIEKFLEASALAGGRLPIPIRYCGADTTGRDSGEEYNPQNLPRISRKFPKPSDALRDSLRAPEGYAVIVADQSGIELRVNHFLWQVPESMELYHNDAQADLYVAFGSDLYGVPAPEISKDQRQVSKVAQLGLGFGAGASTFRRVARVMGGIDLPLRSREGLSAEYIVTSWRNKYVPIVEGWGTCHEALDAIHRGVEMKIDPGGLLTTCKEGIRLPSGRLIRYPDLRLERDPDTGKTEWRYGKGRNRAKIYAGKVDENCVQAIARDSIFDCAVDFYLKTGLRPALRVHDELVYVVLMAKAKRYLEQLQSVMRTPPKWWPELIVWSEGGIGGTYGSAK